MTASSPLVKPSARHDSLAGRHALKFAIVSFLVLSLVAVAFRGSLLRAVAEGLVTSGPVEKAEVLLIENFEPNYLLYQEARNLRRAGKGERIIVPVQTDKDSDEPNSVSLRIAEVMCQEARIADVEFLPVRHTEPITLGVARQLSAKLKAENVSSVTVVTSGFRSRRTWLVYDSLLSPLNVRVSVAPVFGSARPENWTRTWHGIQNVVLQWVKLQYYRWAVLQSLCWAMLPKTVVPA
jgi:hypothetical protein